MPWPWRPPWGPGRPAAPAPVLGRPISPWVRRAGGDAPTEPAMPVVGSHDSGLMARGVHADAED